MIKKLLYLGIYILVVFASILGIVSNSISLASEMNQSSAQWWSTAQLIVFIICFVLLLCLSVFLSFSSIRRIIADIKINKDSK
ncbi:MAG: hypothetical protein KJ971_01000 [Firmicutes bacterium]|nr:hypothetical protein [Bacillota bacterium]